MKLAHAFALLALSATAFAQETWVVDTALGPGSDFSDIQSAVDVASSGDVVLIRAGAYDGFQIDGKGLTLSADGDVTIIVNGFGLHPRITNTLPSQTCVLRGLSFVAVLSYYGSGRTLEASSTHGPILVEDCTFMNDRIELVDVASFTLVRCSSEGTSGQVREYISILTHPALTAAGSNVFAYDSTLRGGTGGWGHAGVYSSQHGAPGVLLSQGSQLYLDGCTLIGGDGGESMPGYFTCDTPKNGGAGLELGIGSPTADLRASSLQGGAAGGMPASCPVGSAGLPVKLLSGTTTTYAEPGPGLTVTSPVREGETFDVVAEGLAGEVAFVGLALDIAPQFLPSIACAQIVDSSAVLLSIGAFPAGGQLAAQATMPNQPVGVEGTFYALQVASCDLVSGTCLLGNPTAPVILDASF